ncbi:MAG: hypothetical protein COX81_00425 [Candidatus Magasanikbacteria bacterium CG_4_10_14_0_2_um_filter_37_12]|uniref:AI-2E family transporter n=1 Tax=Candidatus Magasanikbacteria bacterium CG_4_10_14_0_2_um_filter_37_12 TaxID=1974637 RepID=A0A2M7V9U4_9BACT|nr:MAG: hypothetical protein COX81_00425 [Candidatus Magasanikbacteria bacterium CG_4_10_14_0_2_um_filter_37_12]
MQDVKIHISTWSILKVIAIGVLFYIVILVWKILLLLFIALILAALIDPFAEWLGKRKIPRSIAVLLIYIVLGGIVIFSVTILTPVIASDAPQLLENMGKFWTSFQENHVVQEILGGLKSISEIIPSSVSVDSGASVLQQSAVGPTISSIFSTVTGFFGGVFSLVLVLVMTFYMVAQDDPIKKILRSLAPDEYVPYLSQLFKKMRDKLGTWMRGQLILSLIIGAMVTVGLFLLGVKYAAVLGLLAGLFEFIPYLGPILAAIPALFFAFSQGGAIKFVFVLVMYIIIQQIENHLLVPKVMQRVVGLNPIVSIVAVLIGAKLAGVAGALLAIPVATALSVFAKDVLEKNK